MTQVPWSCRCGAVHGTLEVERRSGTAAICHCDSCVRAQRHFGVEATRAEGVAIFQTTPDRFSIDAGEQHLGLSRLTPKGSFRWHTTCCNSQIGVSSSTPKFAFVGLVQTIFADASAIGRARTHAYVPQPGAADKHTRLMPAIMALMARSVSALSSGRWKDTPFFDVDTRQPLVAPQVLSRDAGRR